ncbi:hypothetical protein [Nocardia crassostreae]|uniref:hypothetical protein n=1 Tax=Nocardia crassostreae TaxID=53428 RepID=UPI00082D62A7|nr:hypothetical protein [Nocardia crassostreae]
MRRTLFVSSVVGAALAVAPLATAQPPAADPGVKVQTVWGPEQFAIAGVTAEVSPCTGGPVAASVITGADGFATAAVGPGCYSIAVGTPSGCGLDGEPIQQVTALPGITPTATFRFRCA